MWTESLMLEHTQRYHLCLVRLPCGAVMVVGTPPEGEACKIELLIRLICATGRVQEGPTAAACSTKATPRQMPRT